MVSANTLVCGPPMHSALEHDVVNLVLLDLKRKTKDGLTLVKRLRDLSAIPVTP